MTPDDFIDLEPTPADTNTPAGANSDTQRKNVEQRKADVQIVTDALPNLRFNLLTHQYEYGSRTQPIVFAGDDLEQMTVKLAVEKDVYIPGARVQQAIKYAAKQNAYCPIRRYLMDCAYKAEYFEEWDQLGKYLLGIDDPIATMAMQRFFIGSVARAYNPGCSFSWIPILIGAQGCGKSQLVREIAPPELFAEITVALELIQKESYRLHVAWILELPEVDKYFNTRNTEVFRNMITTRADEVRLPYQALPQSLHRRFSMIGTSNRSEIFVDPAGNRRFLPLEIPSGFETPWRKLKDVRDRIWASAIREYEKGVKWELTSGDIASMHNYIQQFNLSDPWEELVEKYLHDKEEVTSTEVLVNALSFNPQSAARKDTIRVTAILQQLGWRKTVTTRNCSTTGKRKSVRLWKRAEPLERPTTLNDF